MNYKKYIISKNGKELGLLLSDIEHYLLTPEAYERFVSFMSGQTTMSLGCETIVYTNDFERFINDLPVID